MAEYIRRMSAMTICERYRQHCFESNDDRGQDIAERIFDEITEIPTADVVKVVRCEKCRFACFQYNTDKYPFGVYACKKQPTGRAYKKVKGSHFCSYGELKELNNNA